MSNTTRDFAQTNGVHHASAMDENKYTMPKKLIVCCDGSLEKDFANLISCKLTLHRDMDEQR